MNKLLAVGRTNRPRAAEAQRYYGGGWKKVVMEIRMEDNQNRKETTK